MSLIQKFRKEKFNKLKKPIKYLTKEISPNNYKITAKKYLKKGAINYLITEEKGEKIGNIHNLKVNWLSKRKKIGTNLTKQVEEELKKQGIKKFRIELSEQGNKEILENLLKKLGYKLVSEKEVIIPPKNMNYKPYKKIIPIYEKII